MRIVLLGTGTGVGKTHVGCSVGAALRADGVEVVALKPVESGVEGQETDAGRLAAAAGRGARPLYAFGEAVSPHLAARRAGRRVALEAVVRWVEGLGGAVTLVETAGGALSPLSEETVQADVALALQPARVVLVAADRLGVLHDVRATLEACRRRGLDPLVVLSSPEAVDASTGTNAEELAVLGIAQAAGCFPRAAPAALSSLAAARALLSQM